MFLLKQMLCMRFKRKMTTYTWFLSHSEHFCSHAEIVVPCFSHKTQISRQESFMNNVFSLCVPVVISHEDLKSIRKMKSLRKRVSSVILLFNIYCFINIFSTSAKYKYKYLVIRSLQGFPGIICNTLRGTLPDCVWRSLQLMK